MVSSASPSSDSAPDRLPSVPPVSRFRLTPAEGSELMRSVSGKGGHPLLLRDLQASFCVETSTVTLTDVQIGRIWRMMAYAGGAGGFQRRLRLIFSRSLALPLWVEPAQRSPLPKSLGAPP